MGEQDATRRAEHGVDRGAPGIACGPQSLPVALGAEPVHTGVGPGEHLGAVGVQGPDGITGQRRGRLGCVRGEQQGTVVGARPDVAQVRGHHVVHGAGDPEGVGRAVTVEPVEAVAGGDHESSGAGVQGRHDLPREGAVGPAAEV